MITLSKLLDCLTPPTLAAIIADVQASGQRDIAAALTAHLSTKVAPATSGEHRAGLIRVLAPVPPMLEEAIGYDGSARLVAFYWQPAGDECTWDDGRCSVCGANWGAWLAYIQHPTVWPHLLPYDLGSSEALAEHWLVLDRAERRLYAGPWRAAAEMLRHQYDHLGDPTPSPLPTVEDLIAALEARPLPDMSEIALAVARADRLQEDLITWLDQAKEHRDEL